MRRICWTYFVSVPLIVSATLGIAQTSTPQPKLDKPDYSQEASVVENISTVISFDQVGSRTRDQVTRVRVNTDAGVQQWGLLSFPYQSAAENVEVAYVRVRKTDGTVVDTSSDSVQDLDSEITRSAPFYSDLREKHVAVKGLAKGDILEFEIKWCPTKPLIPGQFWFEYSFHHDGIVLGEKLDIQVPADRPVKFKGPQSTQSIKTEGSKRIYSWTYSKLDSVKDPNAERKAVDAALGRLPAPDVQFSSFQSWEEVGSWYWNLQKERAQPSDAVRAKAAELTKGLTTDTAKLHSLYDFVSVRYRYIGIAFGIGRYQPHSSDDVLGNNYGDCKDKHTLLAALMQASGISLYPALISTSRKLDPEVPSPGQFDHVIGYLPQGDSATWLDTTPEVGPFGYLMGPLRDKQALVMLGDKSSKLMTTPADPPFPSEQTFNIEGKLANDGSFDAHVQDSLHGDAEVIVRAAFRRVPQPQWKDLVQQISYGLGYSGTVSDVIAAAPDSLGEPYHFSYAYLRKDYPDWSNHQFTMPGHPFYMPPSKEDSKDPVWLGPPMVTTSTAKVELPTEYKALVPSDVDLVYDFAEYHATYKQTDNGLSCNRRLVTKQHEVSAKELEDYRAFTKNMQNDVLRYVPTTPSSRVVPNASSSVPGTLSTLINGLQNLPASKSDEANRLESDYQSRMNSYDQAGAANSLKRAVELDPNFIRAWIKLSVLYMMQRKSDDAASALQKAITSDPKSVLVRKFYAVMLVDLHRNQAASEAWRDVLQLAPDDLDANTALAGLLMADRRYAEALPYLETAAKIVPSPQAKIRLGSTYLKAGETEKGAAILEKIPETDKNPVVLNDVAYELADANVDLPRALDLAEKAVQAQELASHDIQLSSLMTNDLDSTRMIGSFWDTLGWVEFRSGHLARAEAYLRASWQLSQRSIAADHLGQLYEKQQRREMAINMYRLAMATTEGRRETGDDPQKHLEHLGDKVSPNLVPLRRGFPLASSGDQLSQMRTVKLKQRVADSGTAEFFLLFSGSSKAKEAKFISGSENLRSVTYELSNLTFQLSFPPESSARVVRRGMLMCSKVSGCQFVLFTTGSVGSVN